MDHPLHRYPAWVYNDSEAPGHRPAHQEGTSQMDQIQRYYNRIIGARRINAPSYTEAARDLERQTRVLLG